MSSQTDIAIFSLPKTGTTTVMHAIQSAGLDAHKIHPNNLEQFNIDDFTKVITLVRDPIARAISEQFETKKAPTSFLEEYKWFTKVLPEHLGIHVFESKFNRVRGWSIYKGRLLVIRTESLTGQLDSALGALLDVALHRFTIEHRAPGVVRFGEEYKNRLERTKYLRVDLKAIYNENNMEHFYTKAQLKGMVERWAKN